MAGLKEWLTNLSAAAPQNDLRVYKTKTFYDRDHPADATKEQLGIVFHRGERQHAYVVSKNLLPPVEQVLDEVSAAFDNLYA